MDTDKCGKLAALEEVIQKLAGPDGCPWDREQTPLSLADYIIEESHELVSAIRSDDARGVCEELGDVFFLLLFIAHLYEKAGKFSLATVLELNRQKMIRRHPHVFSGMHFENMDEQLKAWEAIKKTEHEGQGLYASLPESLPPLIRAYRIHSKAARVGFTWPNAEEVEKQVESEWLEWLDAVEANDQDAKKHELGDILFSLVELGRRHGIKASEALDFSNRRFLRRFARMEELCGERNMADMSLGELDELWLQVKEEESGA